MTLKQLFEYVLIEINKEESPSLLRADFVYWVNKAVQQKCNLDYNMYELNQQLTDNLRVLKTTAILSANSVSDKYTGMEEDIYEVILPDDYFHILGNTCHFTLTENKGCLPKGYGHKVSAIKMTSDMQARLYENAYNRPSYKKPYYYLTHLNVEPTSNYINSEGNSLNGENGIINLSTLTLTPKAKTSANPIPVRLEIRCGDSSEFILDHVFIEYLKTPKYLDLTQEQIDSIEDISQTLEWPDYMCYEIINGLAKLLLEKASDPRLSTNVPINQTIASPIQQQSK